MTRTDSFCLSKASSNILPCIIYTRSTFLSIGTGARIDHAHHDGRARVALDETVAFDEAVRVAKEMTSDDDTLIVVTADHSHAFTSGSYSSRGNDILGDDINFDENIIVSLEIQT